MTPTQVYNTVRNQFYEQDPSFIGEAELYSYMWQAEQEIAGQVECTQAYDNSTTTVASTQNYSKPSDCLYLKRVTWDTVKLKKEDQRAIDAQDGQGYGGSTTEGNVYSYYEWGSEIFLYPIPDSAKTLEFYYIKQPTLKTSSSTALDVPQIFHAIIPDYCLYRAYSKDQDVERAMFHKRLWDEGMKEALSKWSMRQYDDMFLVVKQEDNYNSTEFGII